MTQKPGNITSSAELTIKISNSGLKNDPQCTITVPLAGPEETVKWRALAMHLGTRFGYSEREIELMYEKSGVETAESLAEGEK